jgi:glycosyltransferase involved in cell wall biosynthesis
MTTARPLKVLHVVHALGMGGAETWLMEVLRRWSADGLGHMDFLLTGGARDLFDDEAERLGAHLHYVRYGRGDVRAFAGRLRDILRGEHYDAIHDHQDYVSGWHYVLGAGTLPPVRVTHVHNPWMHISANYAVTPSRRTAAYVGKRLVHRFATHVCGTSAEVLRTYGFDEGGRNEPSVAVAHCGIDVAKFSQPREADRASVLCEFAWPADTKLVLGVGRLDRALEFEHPQNHKNSWLALNVARAAHARDSAVRMIMAGGGEPQCKQIAGAIAEWGLQRDLRLAGVRLDVPRLMRAADVLLFPSREEGLGMAAVEAQAAGLPVLASTAVPREAVVVPELFEVLPLTASVEAWADALLQRVAKPRPSLDVCRSALERSPFSIVHSAERLVAIYRERAA